VEIPEEAWATTEIEVMPQRDLWEPNVHLFYYSPEKGNLNLVTVFHMTPALKGEIK
jgi:hypothetical protein